MKSKIRRGKSFAAFVLILAFLFGTFNQPAFAVSDGSVEEDDNIVAIKKENYTLKVDQNGFRYGFYKPDGTPYAEEHGTSGIRFGAAGGEPSPAVSSEFKGYADGTAAFEVTNEDGNVADVTLKLSDTSAKLDIAPREIENDHYPNRYMQLGPATGEVNNIKLLNLGQLTDHYTIEADVRLGGGSGTSAGILAHYTGTDDYQLFFINKAGVVGLKRMNGVKSIADLASTTRNIQSGIWYRLKMSVDGQKIKCYLNGELVHDVTDTNDVLSGGCGVRVYGSKCDYDNVAVTDDGTGRAVYGENFETATEEQVNAEWLSKSGSGQIDLLDEPEPPAGQEQYYVVDARVGGLPHTYGLGDLGAYDNGSGVRSTANLLGVSRMDDGEFASSDPTISRFVSGFVIAPDRDFGMVVFETDDKRVSFQTDESLLGGLYTKKLTLYYFFGDTKQIYGDYQKTREAEGYYDTKPRYSMFGVGWEAYGSLGWNVYQQSVEDTVDTFRSEGYNLTWAVVGSGFWKGDRKGNEGLTTSFGMWDNTYDPDRKDTLPNPRFPDPDGMKQFFNDRNIPLLLGLRINFRLPADPYGGKYIEKVDGPFTLEGLTNGYFLKDHRTGALAVTDKLILPSRGSVCAFVDGSNPKAVNWYAENALKWGVQGFKEDTMLQTSLHDDSNYNPILTALTEDKNQLMIVRSAAYSLPGDILRANDFNFGMNSNRMPMNLGAFAASGQGNVYPDILGGTGGSTSNNSFNLWTTREAWLDALCPSLSVGLPIWTMNNEEYESAIKKAVTFHSTYAPYIYSAAVKNYETGYPYAHTPLYIAYPDEAPAHELYSTDTQTWEWMMGESLLAAPIWGNDYATQTARDIYLPEGEWMDIETGKTFTGPVTLKDYKLSLDKAPVFVGGKGILVGEDQENKGNYFAEVYPVSKKGTVYEHTHVDGKTKSTITANMDGFNPATLTVTDTTTGKPVKFTVEQNTYAIRFVYEAGHNYELTDGASEGKMRSVSLNCDSVTVGETGRKAHTGVVMDDGSKITDLSGFDVAYEVGNDTILSVAQDGTMTALKAGNTTLRVRVTKGEQTLWSDAVPVTVNAQGITVTSPAYAAELYDSGFTATGTARGVASMTASLKNKRTGGTVSGPSLNYQNGTFSVAYQDVPNGDYILTLTGKDSNGKTAAEKEWPLTISVADDRIVDHFDGPSPLTWQAADPNGTWQVKDGVLRGSVPEDSEAASSFYIADPQIQSPYFLSSDMSIQSGISGGLVFGYQDSKNYYHVRFETGNLIQLYRFVNGTAQLAAEVPYSFGSNRKYKLAVDVDGKQVNVYVNGEQVLTHTFDGDIPKGKAGYRMYRMTADLDDFTLLSGVNTGLVKTSYVDSDGNPLTDPVLLRKPIGAGYETERKEFTGYTLKESPQNAGGTVAAGVAEVTYVYEKTAPVVGSVTVRYVDGDEKDIQTAEHLSGEVGTLYAASAKDIKGYTLAGGRTVTGRFREAPATVVFRYQKNAAPVDKSQLQKLADKYNAYDESKYTVSSFAALKNALENANAVLTDNDADAAQVEKAIEKLTAAAGKLVKLGDKTKLNAVLAQAKAKRLSDYTEATAEKLKAAIQKAEAIAADGQATEADVAKTEADLQDALNGLKAKDTASSENPPESSSSPENPSSGNLPSSSTPSGSSSNGAGGNPSTGENVLPVFVALIAVSACAAVFCLLRRKQRAF